MELSNFTLRYTPIEPSNHLIDELRMRDPFIFVDKQRQCYFLYGTNVKTADGAANIDPFFDYYISEDLEVFYGPYLAFSPPRGFWGVKQYWAPEVHQYGGNIYMFASFKGGIGFDRGTAILRSDMPEGPFVPICNSHMTLPGHECLDGTFFIEDNQPYIIFCHEWTELFYGKIKVMKLKKDLSGLMDEEPLTIVDTQRDLLPWMRLMHDDRVNKNGYLTDAPFLHRLPGGKLLLTWSSYAKSSVGDGGYVIAGVISDSGSIRGPWRHLDKLILDHDAGHSALFYDLKGNLKMVTHARDSDHGRENPVILNVDEHNEGIRVRWPYKE